MDKIKIPTEPPTQPEDEKKADLIEDFRDALGRPSHPYHTLAVALLGAYHQAAHGKGNARHANDRPFEEQPMQAAADLMQTADGLLFQAIKKINESRALPAEAAIHELYGAIIYSAGAILYLRRSRT